MAVQLLSLPLGLVFEPGILSSRHVRRFASLRPSYVMRLLENLRAAASAIAEAKSELDLLIIDDVVHEATHELLEASAAFVEVATGSRTPSERHVGKARERIAKARDVFRSAMKDVLGS